MPSSLHCVCDAHSVLKAKELAPGLSAMACSDCDGQLLMLSDYRRWVDTLGEDVPSANHASTPVAVRDEVGVRHCPSCARLMERLRVGQQPDFRVDRCSSCQSVWMDAGEWSALGNAQLTTRLGEILSDGWQRQLRQEESRSRREAELRARHGDECIDELQRVRTWLSQQEQPDILLALLRSGW